MPAVKISGITNSEDAKWAAILGVEFISVSVIEHSLKKISYDRAEEIRKNLPSYTAFIVETDADSFNVKKIENICPSFVQVKLTQLGDFNELELKIPVILEVPLSDFANIDAIDYNKVAMFHLKLPENFNMDELGVLKETFLLPPAETIIEGDWELSDIKKVSEILKPLAWSIRTIIEKSPRRIDYNKMKHYIREISLW